MTQIIIDTFKGLYNTAFIKIIVMVMVTLLLNILCERGLGVVSWLIVFIPFLLMTVVVTMILYVFGLDAASGTADYSCQNSNTNCGKNITIDSLGNIVIYDPEYNPSQNPVYYDSPNIIVPNPSNNDVIASPTPTIIANSPLTYGYMGSSSPAYQS